jgi:hypothetical protein
MHFFRSREDAETWVGDREGLAILTIREGDELAQAHWVERQRRAAG